MQHILEQQQSAESSGVGQLDSREGSTRGTVIELAGSGIASPTSEVEKFVVDMVRNHIVVAWKKAKVLCRKHADDQPEKQEKKRKRGEGGEGEEGIMGAMAFNPEAWLRLEEERREELEKSLIPTMSEASCLLCADLTLFGSSQLDVFLGVEGTAEASEQFHARLKNFKVNIKSAKTQKEIDALLERETESEVFKKLRALHRSAFEWSGYCETLYSIGCAYTQKCISREKKVNMTKALGC